VLPRQAHAGEFANLIVSPRISEMTQMDEETFTYCYCTCFGYNGIVSKSKRKNVLK